MDHRAAGTSQGARVRPLLMAVAMLFGAATVVYSVAWMFYVRQVMQVEIGIETAPAPHGITITQVWNHSPAQKAGVMTNDVIIAIDGQSLEAPARGDTILNTVWLKSHPGDTVNLLMRRGGVPEPFLITPQFRAMHGAGDKVSLVRRGAFQILGMYPLLFLVVGLAVLFFRLEDSNAWVLALMFAGFIAISGPPQAFLIAPGPLRSFLYAYDTLFRSLFPGMFYYFFAIFPTRSPIERRVPWLKWVLLLLGALVGWGGMTRGEPEALPFINALFSGSAIGLFRLAVSYGSVILGLVSLLLNVISATSVEDRRKLKVILWGTVVGIAPAVVIGLHYDLVRRDVPFWLDFTRVVVLFLLPLSFAYAVVKHRVMAIPVLLKRSARYFLVERGFAILIFVLSIGATLGLAQAFSHRFSASSKTAIPVGATFGVLLISGATQVHRRVRTHLDRAFFRSAYDARQILEDLADRTLNVTSREALAELLHNQICDALHPEAVFIYLRNGDGRLHAYAGGPPAEASSLSEDQAELPSLVDRGAPVDLDPQNYYGSPLDALHAECLVPIRGSSEGHLQGLAILGPRLSEEPYSSGDKRLLASVASQAGIAMRSISLAEKMAERIEAERRSEQEMQIARQVQSRLLPQRAPSLASVDCAGKCIQTRAVGGDYFDFLDFSSGRLGLVLADISGKGISAALLMANLQANLRSQYALATEDLPRLLRSVNQLFYKNTENNHYATTFFALYDDQQRSLRYVNCGHNSPILLRADGEIEYLTPTATVLGLFEDWDCAVAELQLSSGDVLTIYTDGISEAAAGEDEEEFGEARLIEQIKQHRQQSAEAILDGIVAEVLTFSRGEQADDMTMIVARCR